MWKFYITDNREEIRSEKYQTRWFDMMNCSPNSHVFFHPTLVRVWIETYMQLRKMYPLFIWGHTDDGVEVFFPLVLWKKNWRGAFIKSIIPVGYSDYDYHDPLFNRPVTDEQRDSFWLELTQTLAQYGADVVEIDGIRDAMIPVSSDWRQDEICPCLNLSGLNNEEGLLDFLKPKLRGDVRRQIRRLSEQGALELKEYNDHVPHDIFENFIKVHSRKWPCAYKAPGFHQSLINEIHGDSSVHFSTLELEGNPIAWHLGFKYNNTYYYYMPVGNQEYEKYSPVKIHLYYLIVECIKRGYVLFDHLRGAETYKEGWSDGCVYVNHLCSWSDNPTAMLKKLVLKLKQKIK